jgi:hypothetical protein
MSEEQKQMWIVRFKEGTNELKMAHKDYYNHIIGQDEYGIIKSESYELLKMNCVWMTKRASVDKAMQSIKWFFVFVGVLGVVTVIVNTCAWK